MAPLTRSNSEIPSESYPQKPGQSHHLSLESLFIFGIKKESFLHLIKLQKRPEFSELPFRDSSTLRQNFAKASGLSILSFARRVLEAKSCTGSLCLISYFNIG